MLVGFAALDPPFYRAQRWRIGTKSGGPGSPLLRWKRSPIRPVAARHAPVPLARRYRTLRRYSSNRTENESETTLARVSHMDTQRIQRTRCPFANAGRMGASSGGECANLRTRLPPRTAPRPKLVVPGSTTPVASVALCDLVASHSMSRSGLASFCFRTHSKSASWYRAVKARQKLSRTPLACRRARAPRVIPTAPRSSADR